MLRSCRKLEWVLKCGKAGQMDTSEHSQELGMHGTGGLASAQRLCPHGMPVPYFGRTRLGLGPAGTCENRTKEENKILGRIKEYPEH